MIKSSNIIKKCFRQLSSLAKNDVVIAAIARTPISSFPNTSDAVDITATVIDSVIKQAALPRDSIEGVYLVNPLKNIDNPVKLGEQLKKGTPCSNFSNDNQAIHSAFKCLQTGEQKILITAAVSTKLFSNPYKFKLQDSHLIDSEIIPIMLRRKGKPVEYIVQDECQHKPENSIYSGAAMALMTANQAEILKISPLARLRDVECISTEESNLLDTKLWLERNKIKIENINRWELLGTEDKMMTEKQKIPIADVNMNGLAEAFYAISDISTTLSLAHLVHTLDPKLLGCVVSNESALLIEKISHSYAENRPHLTLYTKDPCPLCDELLEELEEHFHDEYYLEKVFIDRKENIRFLRLYRYDIPVLFLNGQFLCMHRLNKERLRRKLNEILK